MTRFGISSLSSKQKKRAQVFLLYVPNDIYPDFFPLSKSRDKLLFGKKVV